jgi:hypothetical protein
MGTSLLVEPPRLHRAPVAAHVPDPNLAAALAAAPSRDTIGLDPQVPSHGGSHSLATM